MALHTTESIVHTLQRIITILSQEQVSPTILASTIKEIKDEWTTMGKHINEQLTTMLTTYKPPIEVYIPAHQYNEGGYVQIPVYGEYPTASEVITLLAIKYHLPSHQVALQEKEGKIIPSSVPLTNNNYMLIPCSGAKWHYTPKQIPVMGGTDVNSVIQFPIFPHETVSEFGVRYTTINYIGSEKKGVSVVNSDGKELDDEIEMLDHIYNNPGAIIQVTYVLDPSPMATPVLSPAPPPSPELSSLS